MQEVNFKHTEIGLIPHDWEVKELGSSALIKARIGWQGLTTKEYLDVGPYYLVTGTDFKDGKIVWSGCHFVTKERYDQDKYIQIKPQDVLVSKDGTIGKVAYLDYIPGEGTLNSGVFVIRSKDAQISQPYLALAFLSKFFDDFIDKIVAGSTIVHLYQKDIINFSFPVPPTIAEQEKIANALSKIDNLITDLDALIEKKRAIKTGTMQHLLTGKKRLEGYTEPWVEKTIDDISELKKGGGLSKEKLTPRGKHKCILYGEIFTAYNYIVKKCKSRTNYAEGLFSKVGDVLMPGSTTTKGIDLAKAVCVMEDNILLGGDIIVIRNSKNAFDPLFLSTYLSEINKQAIAEIAQGITIIHIHAKQVAEVKLVIPPTIEEQNAIASILSSMDTEIAALEQKRDKYIAIKQGMMQNLLTGKIRLV